MGKPSVSVPRPTLHKSIFQARYKPELDYFNRLLSAAKELEEFFPHWQNDTLRITLFDFLKRCSVAIAHDSFSFSQDSNDISQEKEFMERIVDKLPSALQINRFLRFGLRRWYLTTVDLPFDSLVSILNIKLFCQNEGLRKVLPEQVDDIMYVTVNSEEPCTVRIVIGPMHDFEVPNHMPMDQAHHLQPQKRAEEYLEIIKKYPSVALYVEADYFRASENLTIDDASSFVRTADERINRIVSDLNKYFFTTKVET